MNRHLSAAVAATAAVALIRTASAQTTPTPAEAPLPTATEQAPAPVVPAPAVAQASPSAELATRVEMQRADIDEQDSRIAALERQLQAMKDQPAAPKGPPTQLIQAAATAAAEDTANPLKVRGSSPVS